VDENGKLIDGDRMIAVFALDMKNKGILKDDTAVVTVMTNMGFKRFAEENGITVLETKVGDRYVLEEMLKHDYKIGGEQSGHIIFKNFATTGDGQLSGAMLASIISSSGKAASEIASVMTVLPQTLVNITASPELKAKLTTDKEIIGAIDEVKKTLGKRGRILVRASGTEPLIRVMLEGDDIVEIKRLAKQVAKVIEGKE
jgi:phosphoglucosamine mutase